MNAKQGQGRPKQDRRPRQMRVLPNRNSGIVNPPARILATQNQAAPDVRGMVAMQESVIRSADGRMVLPVEKQRVTAVQQRQLQQRQQQQQHPQIVSRDRSIGRQNQAQAQQVLVSTPHNFNVLQNIAVRTPVSTPQRGLVQEKNDCGRLQMTPTMSSGRVKGMTPGSTMTHAINPVTLGNSIPRVMNVLGPTRTITPLGHAQRPMNPGNMTPRAMNPVNAAHRGLSPRQMTAPAAQMFSGPPFRPGGQFIVFTRPPASSLGISSNTTCAATDTSPATPKSTAPVSVLQMNQNQRSGFKRPQPLTVINQPGKLPLVIVEDYPACNFTIYGFTNAHKNTLFRMAKLFNDAYNPMFSCNSHVLMISLRYSYCMCIEVDADIFGEFLTRFIQRLVEVKKAPISIEIRDAPCNWMNEFVNGATVTKSNIALARRIAETLANQDLSTPATEAFTDVVNISFSARRSLLTISISLAAVSHEPHFSEIRKYVNILNKSKDCPPSGPLPEKYAQTEMYPSTPKRLFEQQVLLSKVVSSQLAKCNFRFAVHDEHLKNIAFGDQKLKACMSKLNGQIGEILSVRKKLPKTREMEEYDWANCRSMEAQTDHTHGISALWHPSLKDLMAEYRNIVTKIFRYSTKHYTCLQLAVQSMEKEIAKVKLDLKRKSRSHRESSPRRRDNREKEESLPKESNKENTGPHENIEIVIKEEKDIESASLSIALESHSSSTKETEKRAADEDRLTGRANLKAKVAEFTGGFKDILLNMQMPAIVMDEYKMVMDPSNMVVYSTLGENSTTVGPAGIINFNSSELFDDLSDGPLSDLQRDLDSFYPFHNEYIQAQGM